MKYNSLVTPSTKFKNKKLIYYFITLLIISILWIITHISNIKKPSSFYGKYSPPINEKTKEIDCGYRVFYFRNIIQSNSDEKICQRFLEENGISERNFYINSKYGYSLSYPEDILMALGESDIGDGNNFVSYDGRTYITIYASRIIEGIDFSLSDLYEEDSIGSLYKKKSKNWYVVSRLNGNTIEYKKYILVKDKAISFELRYPLEDRLYWDKYLIDLNKHITIY